MKPFSFKIALFDSYKFLINNIVLFLKTSFIAILLFSLVEYAMKSSVIHIIAKTDSDYDIIVVILSVILQLILLTMFVVVWGQYYLRKMPTIQIIDVLNWNEIKASYIIANLKLFGIVILLSVISYLIISLVITLNNILNIDVLPRGGFSFVVFAPLIVLTRLRFILPHIIDGFSGKISNTMDITKGNSTKLLFSYIGVISSVCIIFFVFNFIMFFIIGSVWGDDIKFYFGTYFKLLILAVFVFISQAIITVYYINVYKQLTQ